jgi:hypothetical protein
MFANNAAPVKRRPMPRSFLDSLHELLPPAIWKQAKQARGKTKSPRWTTQPLVLTLLAMTWCCGDSFAERFETAKGFVAVCLPKRRRPGKTAAGFQDALAKLPTRVLRVVAAGVRRRLLSWLDLSTDGFVVFGCDGSSMETPRVEELEERLDPPLKNQARPQVWVTALVHLRTGLLWSWRLGKGYSRERDHLRALLGTLPPEALIVADAGFNGYDLARAITRAGASFLIRMSGKDRLYTEKHVELGKFKEGEVLLWTQEARRRQQAPLRVRLIRIRTRKKGRDVWLLTNVLDRKRLPLKVAGRYYRWRWENEGLFRTFKRTLSKVRLMNRSVRLVHREAEGALLATQILLAQAAQALGCPRSQEAPQRCSPRKVLLVVRDVIAGKIELHARKPFQVRMRRALREQRERRSAKVKRRWPFRVNHKPPKPPRFLTLMDDAKTIAAKLLDLAA